MRTITIDLADIGADSNPGDLVIFQSPDVRESTTTPGRVVTPAPKLVYLNGGRATVDLEEGPVRVSIRCRNVLESGPFESTVPAGEEPLSLALLLESTMQYTPAVQSRTWEYSQAAKRSEEKSLASEENAKTSETNAKTSETNAKTSEVNAKTSEENAKTSETKAATSEAAAKESEENAGQWAELAEDAAVISVTAASSIEVTVKSNVTRAERAADRAESVSTNVEEAKGAAEAARGYAAHVEDVAADAADAVRGHVAEDADRAEAAASLADTHREGAAAAAAAEVEKLKGGAPEAFDTLKEIADELERNQTDRASLANTIGKKADKVDVEAGLAAKADAEHGHQSDDIADGVHRPGGEGTEGKVVKVGPKGTIYYDRDPLVREELANKGYVDTVASDKPGRAEMEDALSGKVDTVDVSAQVVAGTVVRRDSGGGIRIPEPSKGSDPATVNYVAEAIAALPSFVEVAEMPADPAPNTFYFTVEE